MRIAILVFAVSLLASGACAETAKVDRIDIVEKGIFVIETGKETPDATTPTGKITAVTTARNIESTTTIPARLGLEFGFRYIVVGEPAGTEVTLDIVTVYPAQGLRDPNSRKSVHESRYQRTKKIGDTVYLGYGLENPWEIEPGIWTFQIWYDNRKLADQSFTVVK
jgi:hypothetical protein